MAAKRADRLNKGLLKGLNVVKILPQITKKSKNVFFWHFYKKKPLFQNHSLIKKKQPARLLRFKTFFFSFHQLSHTSHAMKIFFFFLKYWQARMDAFVQLCKKKHHLHQRY